MAGQLTAKQAKFVDYVVQGMAPTQAARNAQFSAPGQDAYRLMRHPKILKALRERRNSRIQGDLAGVALQTMHELMTGETVPAAQRFQASRWVLEHAGHAIPTDAEGGHGAKALEDMSPDELATAVQSGMQALQELAGQLQGHHIIDGQARPVLDVTPVPAEGDPADQADTSFLD